MLRRASDDILTPVAVTLKERVILWAVRVLYGAVVAALASTTTAFIVAPSGEDRVAEAIEASPIDYEGCDYEAPGFEMPGHEGHGHGPLEANGNGKRWPTDKITYWIDFRGTDAIRPALSESAIRNAFRTAWQWWAEDTVLAPVEVTNESEALVKHRFGKIDGSSGTLAWSYLADGTLRPKEQKYDIGERWTAGLPAPNLLSLPTVAAHEIGHVLGLGHDDANAPALMRPSYSANIPREQQRDVQRLWGLGYQKRVGGGGSGSDLLSIPVTIRVTDLEPGLKKLGWTPPKK